MKLTLKPFGPVDPRILEHLRGELTSFDEVVLAPPVPLPASAFDKKRGQYRASVLEHLCDGEDGDRVLGVTAADLYETPLNFVFGHAQIQGKDAVISVARLQDKDPDKLLARAVKEAVHEIGHTLGLLHDEDDPRCVMHFSRNLADTDRKTRDLCKRCEEKAALTWKRLRT